MRIIVLLLCAIGAQGSEPILSVELDKRGMGVGLENGYRIRSGVLSVIEDGGDYIIRWRVDDIAEDYREDYTDRWYPRGRHIGRPQLIYNDFGGNEHEQLSIVCDRADRGGVVLSLHPDPSATVALPGCRFEASNLPEIPRNDGGPTATGIPLAAGWIGVALWAEHPQYFQRNKYQANCNVSCRWTFSKPQESRDRETADIEREDQILDLLREKGLVNESRSYTALPLWNRLNVDGTYAPGAGVTRRSAAAVEWVFPPAGVIWRRVNDDRYYYAEGGIDNGVLSIPVDVDSDVCQHWSLDAYMPRQISRYKGYCTQAVQDAVDSRARERRDREDAAEARRICATTIGNHRSGDNRPNVVREACRCFRTYDFRRDSLYPTSLTQDCVAARPQADAAAEPPIGCPQN